MKVVHSVRLLSRVLLAYRGVHQSLTLYLLLLLIAVILSALSPPFSWDGCQARSVVAEGSRTLEC
jgi:hypothetical protein